MNTLKETHTSGIATDKWCRITNALIRKYKPLTESNPYKVIEDLTRLEGACISLGILTKRELDEAL